MPSCSHLPARHPIEKTLAALNNSIVNPVLLTRAPQRQEKIPCIINALRIQSSVISSLPSLPLGVSSCSAARLRHFATRLLNVQSLLLSLDCRCAGTISPEANLHSLAINAAVRKHQLLFITIGRALSTLPAEDTHRRTLQSTSLSQRSQQQEQLSFQRSLVLELFLRSTLLSNDCLRIAFQILLQRSLSCKQSIC